MAERTAEFGPGDIARSDQFVASGESVSAVHVSPENRKVVRLCGSQRGSQPMLRLGALVLAVSGNRPGS